MKIIYIKCLITSIVCFISSAVFSQANVQPAVGKWEGKLQLPGSQLRIFFQIRDTGTGELKARMASPDQGANNIPVEKVITKGDSIVLEVKVLGGSYSGKFSADYKELKGLWKQGGGVFPLDLKKADSLHFYSKRPQEPVKPYPYKEEDLQYPNSKANISLGATLTIPEGKGPFPAAILISGSGSQNRDEEIMGHKPFLILADYLSRRGIAVLRVDDRGVGKSTGNAAIATTEDNASDVMASMEFLKSRKDIDPKKIGLIGHSEGGVIAPIVASQSPDLAFAVLMAGVGLPGDILHKRQTGDIMRLSGASEADVKKSVEIIDRLHTVIKFNKNQASLVSELTAALKSEEPAVQEQMKASVRVMSTPWFRYFINFNPLPYLQKTKCPVLAINGSKDVQVASKENLEAIEKGIRSGGNKAVTVKELPGLNHLFQTAKTGSMNEYASIDETFSPAALQVIGDWLLKTLNR